MTIRTDLIKIQGLIQGVGFRPTIWHYANELGVCGNILNDGQGVTIIAQAKEHILDKFVQKISQQPPPLARIDSLIREVIQSPNHYSDFTIAKSQATAVEIAISPDAATCESCRSDIFNPDNRRFQYPFTNCTNCGPRFSIIEALPYDRPNTTMREFQLCSSCSQEYQNPSDRRFHAQPNACESCGPQIWLEHNEECLSQGYQALLKAVELIRSGKIIAMRGIGGYQLLCDANNANAVKTLRARKQRPNKALAIMVKDLAQLSRYVSVSDKEAMLLQSAQAPIVLITDDKNILPEAIAPNLNRLGFVLPYSPLHILLMAEINTPIVFTSGNLSNNPQCIDIDQARNELHSIADYYLHHNRGITNRVDDSVISVFNDKPMAFRLSRGYAPISAKIGKHLSSDNAILACGSQVKNTFSLLDKERLITSQHIGDLSNQRAISDYETQIALQKQLFEIKPEIVAVDMHPDYQASTFGRNYAKQHKLACVEVQHHHAHLAACLYDNAYPENAAKVLGVVMDGTGYGSDNTIWGGEFLYGNYAEVERLGRLMPVAMPGSEQAIKQPWRMLYSYLQQQQIDIATLPKQLLRLFQDKPLATIDRMLAQQLNSPLTSSCGRLFDAVAATLGICAEGISYEAQAAIELQQIAENYQGSEMRTTYQLTIVESTGLLTIDTASLWPDLLQDLKQQLAAEEISAKFHIGFAQVITDLIMRLAKNKTIETAVLCGGVFQNQYLLNLCLKQIKNAGINCLYHNHLPSNDACISVGQACVAATNKPGA